VSRTVSGNGAGSKYALLRWPVFTGALRAGTIPVEVTTDRAFTRGSSTS